MMIPAVQGLLERPFSWIPQRGVAADRGGFVLGLALGAVYVPCAGPVLAAISVAGATGRIGGGTVALTLAYAAGNAIPLLFFALAGRRLAERLRAFRRRQRGIRVAAGAVVIALAVALTFNLTDAISRAVPDYTTALKVDFWAYSCINCQRAISHVTAWYSTYRSAGFEVIGVHTPEYAFEHVAGNVAAGAKRLGIDYPVALDNDYTTWTNYNNDSWPADYLIDATGTVRHVSIGEGDYPGTESLIRQLLGAANPGATLPPSTNVADTTPTSPTQTEETYLGAQRANNYAGDPPLSTGTATFSYPSSVPDDQFALSGTWSVSDESLTAGAGAGIELNYLADDIYLDVGGTGTITATIDGKTATYPVSGAPNIYTLLHRDSQERGTLRVTLSPGLNAYSFTFG